MKEETEKRLPEKANATKSQNKVIKVVAAVVIMQLQSMLAQALAFVSKR